MPSLPYPVTLLPAGKMPAHRRDTRALCPRSCNLSHCCLRARRPRTMPSLPYLVTLLPAGKMPAHRRDARALCPHSRTWSPCCLRARCLRTGETPAHYALAPVICRTAACGQDARAPARRPRTGIVQGRHLASPRTGRPNDPTVPYSGAFVNPCAILSPCHSQSMTTRRMAI